MEYEQFLKNKVIIAENHGFKVDQADLTPILKPHQKDIVEWCLLGGRRAIFASFGLGKTFMQLEIAKLCIEKYNMPFLICCPLAVAGEFKRDNEKLGTGLKISYITDTDTIDNYEPQIFITNYERVRMGDIDPAKFCGVSFDEASILRNLKTETTNMILATFAKINIRIVATATPSPNDLIEILNYAVFLGIASRGHLLTRFFQRDSVKAGHLTIYPNKAKEFWQWVATWAIFINKPSDLGYDNTGYDLPELIVHEHCVKTEKKEFYTNKYGEQVFFKDISKSLLDVSREKRDSVEVRCEKAFEISKQYPTAILWHHLEAERDLLEKYFKEESAESVWGGQTNQQKEKLLIDFSENRYNYLLTKPKIAGSGCNFQEYCNSAVFVGIDYKFNDFIQSIHRIFRFGQTKQVHVHIIYTDEENAVLKVLYEKWENHKKLQNEMIDLVKEYGFNTEIIKMQMERQLFKDGKKITIGNATLYNNDTVIVTGDKTEMPDNSIDHILTSIPFGDHYEYSDNYNDFGHNHGNEKFFEQMDYLTPNLLRVLKPGRIAAIHVKDRIRYSYQNGTKFTTIADFSGQTVSHFIKHGFYLMGKITITTDVVRENNQTYRLGHTEQCKDASKMGVGLPEYLLIFRKAPSHMDNAYADEPISKTKEEYPLPIWQLDAHAYQRSSGDRLLTSEEIAALPPDKMYKAWEIKNINEVYQYKEHIKTCDYLDELGKLSRTFTSLPVHSNTDMVWTDINRMNTLNAKQVSGKKEKHICLAQGSLVLTQRGYIPIETIEVEEDLVFTHLGRWRKVIAKQKTGENQEVIKVHAQGVPNLIVTPTHKVWARFGKDAHHPTRLLNEPNWVESKDLGSGYLNQKLPPEVYSGMTNNDWWIIGRWLADGHIDVRGHQFIISVGNDKIEEFERKCKDFISLKVVKSGCVQYPLKNLPQSIRNVLFKCGQGAENKVLPIEAISLNKELSEALLLGYISGDGHLDKKGRYHITSISRALLLGFSIVAQRAWNIIPSVYAGKKAGKKIIEGREVNTKQCWIILLQPNGRHSFGKILNDGAWKKVRKIEAKENSDVWNIRVEEDESYTAEGCIVKNCPLQIDIIERSVNRFTKKGETVYDPFGGLFSTPYQALKMGRKAKACELNSEYFADGVDYVNQMNYNLSVPTLFDMMEV